MLTADVPPGFPINVTDARRRQLGGRACQAGPLPGFRARQLESTKASIECLLSGEHVIDNGAELLRDERTRDRFSLPSDEPRVLSVNLGEVLRRPHSGMVKGDLQIAIPIVGALVPTGGGGIVRPRHEPTIGMKLAHGGEPADVVDLEQHCVCDHRPDAWDPDESLRVGRGQHAVSKLMFQPPDLGLQQRVLLGVQRRLEPRQLGQVRRSRDIVLLKEGSDTPFSLE